MTSNSLANNPKSFYEEIPHKERSSYRKKMIQIQQLKGQQPIFYHKQYPRHENFIYQDFKLNYGFIEQSAHPQALIFYFHGMYCYGDTSGYLADVISSKVKNVNIYALDFKNAGSSEGQCPGYYTVQQLQDQALKFIGFIEQKFKSTKSKPKIFLMGESMGGLITFKLCTKYPQKFNGAVLLAPALRDCSQNIPFLKNLGRIMGCLCPTLKIVPQDFIGFTRYENFEFMRKEKGRYIGHHPPGTARSILKQMDTCHKHFHKMQTPYLCIQGAVDKSVDLFAPLDLEKESVSKDKTTIFYNQVWHDILMQKQIKQISPIIAQWIKKRI